MKKQNNTLGKLLVIFMVAGILIISYLTLDRDKTKENYLLGIEVIIYPRQRIYIEGEIFNQDGLVVIARYSDNSVRGIRDFIVNRTILTLCDKEILISYAEKTLEIAITVLPKTKKSIEVLTMPEKTEYIEGQFFDKSGLLLKVLYDNGESIFINNFIVKRKMLTVEDYYVTVGFIYNNIVITINIEINVRARKLDRIRAKVLPNLNGKINLNDMIIVAYYDNGDSKIINNYIIEKELISISEKRIIIIYAENGIIRTFEFVIEYCSLL